MEKPLPKPPLASVKERTLAPLSGQAGVLIQLVGLLLAVTCFVSGAAALGALLLLAVLGMSGGYFLVPEGEARLLFIQGAYRGTVKKAGFYWGHPLATRKPLSLARKTLRGETLQLADKAGYPVEAAVALTWQVERPGEAALTFADLDGFVADRAEAVARQIVEYYPFEAPKDPKAISISNKPRLMRQLLEKELGERLSEGGLILHEARFTVLRLAPEAARLSLRRKEFALRVAQRQELARIAPELAEQALRHYEQKQPLTETQRFDLLKALAAAIAGGEV